MKRIRRCRKSWVGRGVPVDYEMGDCRRLTVRATSRLFLKVEGHRGEYMGGKKMFWPGRFRELVTIRMLKIAMTSRIFAGEIVVNPVRRTSAPDI